METAKKADVKKILSIVANVLIWAFVIFSVFTTILALSAQGDEDGVPSVFGKSLITVASTSMEPTFKQGDLLLMTKVTEEEAKVLPVDTIITYRAPIDINDDGQAGDINTHRIVKNENGVIITRGDNTETNFENDTYTLNAKDIIGTVEEDDRIPVLGAIIAFLGSSLGFFLCIVLPLALFFIYELYNFIRLLVTEKAKNTPVSSDVEEEIKRKAIEEYLKQQAAQSEEAKPSEETKQSEEESN